MLQVLYYCSKEKNVYDRVKQVVLDSGLWDGEQRETHGFLLSPDVYTITESQRKELEDLGMALRECLGGLCRIAAIACAPKLAYSVAWKELGSILRKGIPSHYHDIQVHKPGQLPAVFKVDFIRTSDSRYVIAEIDGHNKHGLGYSVLCARMRNAVAWGQQTFLGVERAIEGAVEGLGKIELTLLYADQERFYLPEFLILKNGLARKDVKLTVKSEAETSAKELEQAIKRAETRMHFVDFPFFYHNVALNELLARMYKAGKIDFLYPPKPFLSSKALLALLRNDGKDPELEAILLAFIPKDALECARRYIPETHLVRKRKKDSVGFYRQLCGERNFVLKEVISSGMHGTVFSDDKDFEKTFQAACSSYNTFILQEEMTNAPHPFSFYTSKGEVENASWFLRIIVLYDSHFIADIDVTARKDKRVHGSKDCLQLGTIIVSGENEMEKLENVRSLGDEDMENLHDASCVHPLFQYRTDRGTPRNEQLLFVSRLEDGSIIYRCPGCNQILAKKLQEA